MPINYNRYPPNWKSEIRPAVLERAGNKCEECGLENGSMVWAVKFQGRTLVLCEGQGLEVQIFK